MFKGGKQIPKVPVLSKNLQFLIRTLFNNLLKPYILKITTKNYIIPTNQAFNSANILFS